jgi:hypothetical protein
MRRKLFTLAAGVSAVLCGRRRITDAGTVIRG